jgi:hypothetical protein
LSRELARAKERYASAALTAYREAALNLQPVFGVPILLSGWSRRVEEAYNNQWPEMRHPDAGWDWHEIFRRHKDPDRFPIVMWGPNDRLCGLSLVLTTGRAVEVRFLEGDPRSDCPLKGRRIPIALEAAACYGQGLGKTEIRVHPVNDALEDIYIRCYGFIKESPRGEKPFFRRAI